jgi:C4-dicarboxylate transporter DctM subunit
MWLTRERIPHLIAEAFQNANLSPVVTMMLINIFLLLLGTFMDSAAAQIITTPILVPVAESIGYDPIHFGVIMITNLAVGMLTPPLGVSLVVAAQVAKTSFESIIKPSIPLMIILIIDIVLITLLPQISIGFANLLD